MSTSPFRSLFVTQLILYSGIPQDLPVVYSDCFFFFDMCCRGGGRSAESSEADQISRIILRMDIYMQTYLVLAIAFLRIAL